MDAASTPYYNALNANPLRYRGYIYDSETEFYYLQSRYYDPAVRRFINVDGYVSTGTGTLGYNMFAYCNNSPVAFADSTGDIALSTIALGVLVIASVVATINDIYQIYDINKTMSNDDQGDDRIKADDDNVRIVDSDRIVTPWMQLGYSYYLNHHNETTKDVLNGSTKGIQLEWEIHNLISWASSLFNCQEYKESARSVDIGNTIFSDDHGKKSFAMFLPHLSNGLIFWADLIVNNRGGE